MISNCSLDENGKAYGGKAGDNNGKEWRIRSWYDGKWTAVLRYPNETVANLIAQMAEAAANNNAIGYNQHKRLTFWAELVKADFHPENIKTACEADCSAGAAAIVKAAGYRLGISSLKLMNEAAYTGNIRKALEKVGFETLSKGVYLTSDKYLKRGDLLLREPGHICINLTNGVFSGDTVNTSDFARVVNWQQAAVKDGFSFPKYGVDGEWGSECEKVAKKAIIKKRLIPKYKNLTRYAQRVLGVETDGICGNETKAAIMEYQKENGLSADGVIGLNTWRYLVEVRSNAKSKGKETG